MHSGLIKLFSFGHKYGFPEKANLICDVRFLPNPYYVKELKHCTGKETKVGAYVLDNPSGKNFLHHIIPFIKMLCREFSKTNKECCFTLAVGCTGGKHRSVAVAEYIAILLTENKMKVQLTHRDIHKS